jgi:hypothetical protein
MCGFSKRGASQLSNEEDFMSKPRPVEYADASAEVRAVFDDIKATRKVTEVNNFWKYLAADPALLKRTWETQKAVLAPAR